MANIVTTDDQTATDLGDSAKVTIGEGGVLVVMNPDGSGTYYSPGWWRTCEVSAKRPSVF